MRWHGRGRLSLNSAKGIGQGSCAAYGLVIPRLIVGVVGMVDRHYLVDELAGFASDTDLIVVVVLAKIYTTNAEGVTRSWRES